MISRMFRGKCKYYIAHGTVHPSECANVALNSDVRAIPASRDPVIHGFSVPGDDRSRSLERELIARTWGKIVAQESRDASCLPVL